MHIRLEGLSKTYRANNGVSAQVLENVDLELKSGSFCAILGPSGSGKTTLLNLVGCIDSPTAGAVFFDDQNVSGQPERLRIRTRRQHIGYIFQSFNLVPTLTALENGSLPFWSDAAAVRRQRMAELKVVFERLGIGELADRYPRELSGGQEQRVAIARALANQPSIVLADEPTGNLDASTALGLMQLLKAQNAAFGTTFLVATHDQSLLPFFDTVLSIRDGRLESAS